MDGSGSTSNGRATAAVAKATISSLGLPTTSDPRGSYWLKIESKNNSFAALILFPKNDMATACRLVQSKQRWSSVACAISN
jgi:hypothetical protein